MSSDLLFADELEAEPPSLLSRLLPWQVLIVDDEPVVHEVTQLVMSGFEFDGRKVSFLHAYSAAEAREVLGSRNDIALLLLDVVMETEHAGLDLARWIREELGNRNLRIVLRTGQPGQAPEELVIRAYDINDYKEKTELTRSKLISVFYASLRGYRDLMRLEHARLGLRRTINAISAIYDAPNLRAFASAVLEQLNQLLNVNGDGLCASRMEAYTACSSEGHMKVLAATEAYSQLHIDADIQTLPANVQQAVQRALEEQQHHFGANYLACYYRSKAGSETVVYMSFADRLEEEARELLEIFTANVAITYETLLLRDDLEETQRSTIYILGEAVERRSKETGAHVKRVGEITALLGAALQLPARDVADLRQAAPLHDVGKIGIPDAILNKPGKLTAEEWEVMQTHARLGYELLNTSDKRVLQLAAVIAHEHHERWDGKGYPQQLAGSQIHIAGRISALADVVDALVSNRCYKAAWTLEQALEYVGSERGGHFDPQLVDLLFASLQPLQEIYRRYPDI
jgi:response regulator RpfG family c-di-GMP phosphodiesterase